MTKKIEMSGRKFGSLTVLKYIETGKNGARWECECDCGNHKIVDGYLLRRGSVKTCGCGIGIKNDFIDKRFGKLKILKKIGVGKDRSLLWEALCDCGNLIQITSKSLLSGNTKSCGCLRKLEKGEANLKKLYRGYEKEAKRKNIQFDLPIKDFKEITSKNCFYCGISPEQIADRKFSNGAYLFNGIDRIDNSIGYITNNITPCCFVCNRAKSTMSQDKFIEHLRKISKKWK